MPPLSRLVALGLLAGLLQTTAPIPRFYPDDPLAAEPTPLPVPSAQRRALSAILDAVDNRFSEPGERHPANGVIAAGGVNTLGEVMDGDWYVNRQAVRRMTMAELRRGSGDARPPATGEPWQVLVVKPFGLNSGIIVADAKHDLYLLRFDPPEHEGLATGAQMVASRFLYALGYYLSENYLVTFDLARLVPHAEGQAVSSAGNVRALVATDIDAFLKRVAVRPDGHYRAVAVRLPESRDALLGPYQFWGTRSDDPNDTVAHEQRRDLRGLSVFAAWLNISNMRAVGTQDILTTVDGVPRIRHYLVDLTRSLGSGVLDSPKLSWEGNEGSIPSLGAIGRNIIGLGIATPSWMKEPLPNLPAVGAFGSSAFDPEAWTTNEPLAPFVNRLPDDEFWAARQVMAFTDEAIRAAVETGQYDQPAADWIAATLIERRNRIGRAFYSHVLPLDHFRLSDGALEFDDLAVAAGFVPPRTYTIEWFEFDNLHDALGAKRSDGPSVPASIAGLAAGSYVAVQVHAGDPGMNVTVYLRKDADRLAIVGIDRAWPGRVLVPPPPPPRADHRVFEDLAPRQRELFSTYVESYNSARGSHLAPDERFAQLTISEQTTFYGVTHALLHSPLTDASGASMGLAIDRVAAIQRVAGQYPGKGGDEQFRVYVALQPDTRQILEKSREFFRDRDNTVYHVGYPLSFRQLGKEPSIQISVSDDGLRGDIDVDYRSSKTPQSLFNGHLTAANSDVRAGENPRLHNDRWHGLVEWWRQVFGRLKDAVPTQSDLLGADRPDVPTPLPPDRPIDAAPDLVQDAAQEFLTDWLVRRHDDEALAAVSTHAFACVSVTGDAKDEALDANAARRELRRIMEYSSQELGVHADLTSIIHAYTPRDPNRPAVDQAFRREFFVSRVPAAEAKQYLCDPKATPPGTEYYAVIFTFRVEGGGTLALLWNREDGRWKIVSFRLLEQ